MTLRPKPFSATKALQVVGALVFAYLFLGFMLLPCLNTLTSVFTTERPTPSRCCASSWRATWPSMSGTR